MIKGLAKVFPDGSLSWEILNLTGQNFPSQTESECALGRLS